jgi:hypothetical protein
MKKFLKQVYADESCKYINNLSNLKNKGIIYKLDWILFSQTNSMNPIKIYSKIVSYKK